MTLSLGDSANWEMFYQNTYNRRYDVPVTHPDYAYIGEIILPVLINSNILTVKATTSNGKPNWKQAGNVRQIARTSIPDVGITDSYLNKRYLISLDKSTLLIFDREITPVYALWFRPFDWIPDITLQIYTYTGEL